MTFDATDRKAIKRREKQAKQREAQRHNYTRHIMADRFGREWMWDLLERCHIFQTPFIGGQPDQTSFNLGEHNFGLQLLSDIMTACPQDYQLMAQEAQTRNLADDRRDSDHGSPEQSAGGSEELGRDDPGHSVYDYNPYTAGNNYTGSEDDTIN